MSIIEYYWRYLLFNIYIKGHSVEKDDAPIRELNDIHLYLENPAIIKGSPISSHGADEFLANINKGIYNIDQYPIKNEALGKYVSSLSNKQLNGFVYTYPNRLFDFFPADDGKSAINQLDVAYERLLQNAGTNRAVGVLYDPSFDSYETDTHILMKDIPCWNHFQFLIRDDKLDLYVLFRSNDIYSAFPSNMMLLTYIGLQMQERLLHKYPSLKFGGIRYNCNSCHYYVNDVDESIFKEMG